MNMEGKLFSYQGHVPRIDPSAYVAPGAMVVGRAVLGPRASLIPATANTGKNPGAEKRPDTPARNAPKAGRAAAGSPAERLRLSLAIVPPLFYDSSHFPMGAIIKYRILAGAFTRLVFALTK